MDEFEKINQKIREALAISCRATDSFCVAIDKSNGQIKKALLGEKDNAGEKKDNRFTRAI